jgi:hypothetical protein
MPAVMTEERRMARMVESGSTAEALGGIAAVVLAIVGLAHISAEHMMAIAAIVMGVAFLVESGMVAAEFKDIVAHFEGGPSSEFGGGLGAEAVTGVLATVLGILALLEVSPATLMSIAAITLGAGLILSSGVTSRLKSLKIQVAQAAEPTGAVAMVDEAVSAASVVQIIVGVGVIILGVLALIGLGTLVLNLVSMLAVGGSMLLTGGAVFGKMWSLLRGFSQ